MNLRISSSKPVLFRRFFTADWNKGAFIISATTDRTLQVRNPLWLTHHLLRNKPTRAGFLRWLFSVTNAQAMFSGHVVIPQFGRWHFVEGEEGFICSNGRQQIIADYLYQRWKMYAETEPRELPPTYYLNEQVPLLITEGRPGSQRLMFGHEQADVREVLER